MLTAQFGEETAAGMYIELGVDMLLFVVLWHHGTLSHPDACLTFTRQPRTE